MQPETCSWKMKLYKLICKCCCCSCFKTKSLSPEFDDIESHIPKENKETITGGVEREKMDLDFKFQEIEKKLKKLQEIEKLIWISKYISPQTVILPEPVQTNQAPRISNLPILKRPMGESMKAFLDRLKCNRNVHIILAGKKGKAKDGHGNMFYCLTCQTSLKDHTSFQTKKALKKHCKIKHGFIVNF